VRTPLHVLAFGVAMDFSLHGSPKKKMIRDTVRQIPWRPKFAPGHGTGAAKRNFAGPAEKNLCGTWAVREVDAGKLGRARGSPRFLRTDDRRGRARYTACPQRSANQFRLQVPSRIGTRAKTKIHDASRERRKSVAFAGTEAASRLRTTADPVTAISLSLTELSSRAS